MLKICQTLTKIRQRVGVENRRKKPGENCQCLLWIVPFLILRMSTYFSSHFALIKVEMILEQREVAFLSPSKFEFQ